MDTETIKKAPVGTILTYGASRAGKTMMCLNAPRQPVHVIDTEDSSGDYERYQDRLIEAGVIKHRFTRTYTPTFDSYAAEFGRITGATRVNGRAVHHDTGIAYGTLVIDTGGQMAEWLKQVIFEAATPNQVQNMSQVVWGRVRDALRTHLLHYTEHCEQLILVAHERKYNKVYSPRINPAVLELTSVTIRLVRKQNQLLPEAHIDARLPFFPPRIPEFTLQKLYDYVADPADWSALSDEEIIPQETIDVPTGFEDEEEE